MHSPGAANGTAPAPTFAQPAYRRVGGYRPGVPIEPWRSELRWILIVWGILLLAAFAAPLTLKPLVFNWDAIIHRTGRAEIPVILIAAIGFLGVAIGAIPMPPLARGILAALLGLSGMIVPIALGGVLPPALTIATLAGLVMIVASLLTRSEYTESLSTRIVVTLAVIALLLPFLVPQNSEIPLIALVKSVTHGDIATRQIIAIITIVLTVISLLVWLPGPATGGAAMFAWLFLLLPLVSHTLGVVLDGDIDRMAATPNVMLAAWVPASGYLAFAGYGIATIFGKLLE